MRDPTAPAKHFRVINVLDACTPTVQTTMLRHIALCGYRHHWFSMEKLKSTFYQLAIAAYRNTDE
jgi:hypothetical protein